MTSTTSPNNCYDYSVFYSKNVDSFYLQITYNPEKSPVLYELNDKGESTFINSSIDFTQLEDITHEYQDRLSLAAIQQLFVLATRPNVDALIFYFTSLINKLKSPEYNYDSSRDFSMEMAYKLEDFKNILLQNHQLSKDDDDLIRYDYFNKNIDTFFYDQKKIDNAEIISFLNKILKELSLYKNQ